MKLPPILVLAGGMGTRVNHLYQDIPKCLIPINGRPFVDWQLDLLEKNGLNKVVFSVGYKENALRNYLCENPRKKLEISFVSDGPTLLGTGGAIVNSISELGNEFLVIYGDSYLTINFNNFYKFAQEFKACISYFRNENKLVQSNILKLDDTKVIYNKSNPSDNYMHVDYGLLYFKTEVFNRYKNGAKFDLADLLEEISANKVLYGYEELRRFFEIGSEKGIKDLSSEIKANYE